MAQLSLENPLELEGKTKPYLELIRRIDAILAGPVNSLIRITHEYINKSEQRHSDRTGFPVWIADYIQPEPEDDLFSKAICFATLQEIGKLRRRFSWLSDSKLLGELLTTKQGKPDQEALNPLIKSLLPSADDFESCIKTLSSNTFGALDPLTASQTYQVLMRDSERQTHGALGSLALFAMIWPLFRRFPDPQRFGAAIEPWEAKAYVTAKCILPIKMLQDICTERASLMTDIVKILEKLKTTTEEEKHNPYQRWRFNAELDDLRVRLLRLSGIVVAKDQLRRFSEQLKEFSDGLSQDLGSSLFTIEDLKNPTALAIKLRDCSGHKLSAYLKDQCSQETQKGLNEYDGSGPPARALLNSLVEELNRLLKGPCLFENERFRDIELSEETEKFVTQEPRGHARIRVNWLLLKEAYPNEIAMSQGVTASYRNILRGAARAIRAIGHDGVGVLKKANEILETTNTEIVQRLNQPSQDDLKNLGDRGIKFAREYTAHPDGKVKTAYFNDLHTSALSALSVCSGALKILNDSYSQCSGVTSTLESIKKIVSELATANRKVAEMMDDLVRDATTWCRTVADREIAHASAQNLTDFDPSELVSAIAVSVKWNQMTTTLQISDAVDKALAGMRADGSWSPGQPFYSPNNAVGIWPITSDVVLTLTEALEEHREVDVADAALFRYVDWLERTRTELKFQDQSDQKTSVVVGWPSDRFRNRRKIHFPTTAYSINALVKIRDLVEYRLWQLCEKRFTVIKGHDRSGLKEAAPVDLGAQHSHRLHRHLAWIAEQQKSDYKQAEYSIVLHGPPGSSKTFIAQALSVEQWKATRPWGSKEAPRMVRITPADFTRMGEDRLDSEARLIFDLLSGVRGVTIFFDEIDDLLRQRNTGLLTAKPTFMELVVPAMLNRLADLREACPRQELCVVLATNFVESIEPALLRKGRIDRPFPVVYPDQESRHALIVDLITDKRSEPRKGDESKDGDVSNEKEISKLINAISGDLAKESSGWPYLTIKSACLTVRVDLKQTLEYLRSDEGKALPLEKKKEKFWSKGRESISKVVEEHGPSIQTPKYKQRLMSSSRPELLNEYAHFIIAGLKDSKDLQAWVKKSSEDLDREFKKKVSDEEHTRALNELELFKAVCAKIKTVLDEENRWIEDRTVREMLASASGSPQPGNSK